MSKKSKIPEGLIILAGVIGVFMAFPVVMVLMARWVTFVLEYS